MLPTATNVWLEKAEYVHALYPPNCTAWGGRRCYWKRKILKYSLAGRVNRSLRYIWMHSGPPRIVPQPSVLESAACGTSGALPPALSAHQDTGAAHV